MLWFMLALTAALSTAVNDTISKRFFSHLSPYEMGLIRLLYASPYFLLGLIVVPWPTVDATFWGCLAVGLPLEVAAFMCYMRAIKVSPLSLTLPFLSFTPAFVLFTGYILLGETLSVQGIMGVVLIVAGSYVLHLSKARGAWMTPFKAILGEEGSLLMLLTSFLYSFTATLGKLAIQHSSQPFFAVTYFTALLLLMAGLFPRMGHGIGRLTERPLPGIMAGLVLALMIFTHTLAISLVEAAYMLSVKRSSLLFGVLFGALIFKEENVGERLLGASFMMAGVCFITIDFSKPLL
jgi:drug/metabolite transporter (DMT)-like permease